MDSNGLSDPYVKLHLLPGANKVRITHSSISNSMDAGMLYIFAMQFAPINLIFLVLATNCFVWLVFFVCLLFC